MHREINFHGVFPGLLPRLSLVAARSSFRNGLRSADLRMSRLRILRDARAIIRGFYRYDIITWKVSVVACHLCLNNLERDYLYVYIGCLTHNGNSLFVCTEKTFSL